MARPSEDFLLAWTSLTGIDRSPGWQAITLPPSGHIEIQAGRRSPDNSEAILLTFPGVRLPQSEKLPEGQGFSVERVSASETDFLQLALTRKVAGSSELFAAMACDVVGALDEASSADISNSKLLRAFLGRVGAWQEFMRKGSPFLSPESEIGLIGELILLQGIIDSGISSTAALESWVGPLDAVQDFALGAGALEVKTTLSTSGFPVHIGSLDQLDDSVRQPLFLAGVRLALAETGQNLTDHITSLREATKPDAEAARLLGDRLIAAGYFELHSDRYVRRFTLNEIRIVEVNDAFPRLTPSKLSPAITKASYELNLERIPAINTPLTEALQRLGLT